MIFPEESLVARYAFEGRGTFVDVGAHAGTFLAPFAKRGWPVVAFEPHPALFARLNDTYGKLPNVQCVQRAISDTPGRLPFYTSDTHSGINSLAAFHPTHRPTVTVVVSTLREELSRLNVGAVTAMKIDVEGADFLALRGFDFGAHRPELVMVEFMDDRSSKHFGYTHHDMARYMGSHGYDTWVSEWAPIVGYGREGIPSSHRWIGFHAYSGAGAPAHGNLVFVSPRDGRRLKVAVRQTVLRTRARGVARSIPGARSVVRCARHHLGR